MVCLLRCQLLNTGSDPNSTSLCRHPDKNLDKPEEAKSKFQKIYAAFQKLSNTHSDSEDSDDDFFMGEDMEDAFSFFMNM